MTYQKILDRVNLLLGDSNNKQFSEAEKKQEINNVLVEISSRLKCYIKQADIQLEEDREVYELPTDMVAALQFTLDGWDGEILFSTTHSALAAQGNPLNRPYNRWQDWGFTGEGLSAPLVKPNQRLVLRDFVSANEFHVYPAITADNYSTTGNVLATFGA